MARLSFTLQFILAVGCSSQSPVPSPDPPAVQLPQVAAGTPKPEDPTFWKSPGGNIADLQFSSDDQQLLVTYASDKPGPWYQIVLLNLVDGAEVYRHEALYPMTLCLSPDSSRLAVLDARELTLHDVTARQVTMHIDKRPFLDVYSLGFTADSAVLVGGGEYLDLKKKQYAWDATNGQTVAVPDGPIAWSGRGLSTDGSMFASGGWPGPSPRICATDGSGLIAFCFRSSWPTSGQFTPDNANFVTIHEDGLLVIWEIKPTDNDNARQLANQQGYDGCRGFAISHDQKRIATAESDGSIRLRRFLAKGEFAQASEEICPN